MKSTIKLSATEALVIQPGPKGTVQFDVTVFGMGVLCRTLTPDQCGALLFGLESAAEASRMAVERDQLRAA